MASFRCYDSSDVIATLIMTNFPLYLIQLWWQFFPNACLWRRSLCSNLAGIDSEKLYRATFICQYGLFCCMALVSFRLFCKNLVNLREFFGQMDYRPPLAKNCPYAYGLRPLFQGSLSPSHILPSCNTGCLPYPDKNTRKKQCFDSAFGKRAYKAFQEREAKFVWVILGVLSDLIRRRLFLESVRSAIEPLFKSGLFKL